MSVLVYKESLELIIAKKMSDELFSVQNLIEHHNNMDQFGQHAYLKCFPLMTQDSARFQTCLSKLRSLILENCATRDIEAQFITTDWIYAMRNRGKAA